MALSATGRTLRIRRQLQQYSESPQSDDFMEDEALSRGPIRLKKVKGAKGVNVRLSMDGAPEQFTSAQVIGVDFAMDEEADDLSSDDEIFRDVKAYVRQTMGKQAVVKAESGICGGGQEEDGAEASRAMTPWLDGSSGGNYVTVRHPSPDAPIDTPPLPGSEDGLARKIIYPNGLSYQLPLTCRHWFSPKHVADIERAELGIFGITEEVYRDLRDRIIDAYNVDPSKFLSVRNAREATGFGEIGVLTKVWGFLDYWGIINYLSDASTAPRFSKKLIDFPIGRPSQNIEEISCSVCHKPCSFSAYVLKPEAAPLVPKEQISAARFCSACINTGSYPPFFTKDSFEQIDVVLPGTKTDEFSEEETMRMIEAIDRYGTDWEAVSQMVGGGKTAAQCLLHFIQIPILDRFMATKKGEDTIVPTVNPMRDQENPLLPLLTVLASAVPSDVSGQVAKLVLSSRDVDMN